MSSPYAQKGSSRGSVYAQKGSRGGSVYAGRGSSGTKKKGHGGLLHAVAKYSGAQLAGNLAKDVGHVAVGVGPGLYKTAKDIGDFNQGLVHGDKKKQQALIGTLEGVAAQEKDYYGHDVRHHLYQHPLQPVLDALTVADLGATAGVKLGALSADRAALVTRSPRAIATGKGPRHVDISSTKPLIRGREVAANKLRANERFAGGRIGEVRRYGKQIQAQATQHALGRLNDYQPYLKATKHLSQKEWAALHIRAMDIHPDDLAQLWKGTPAEKWLTDGKTRQLVLKPSKRMQTAEPEARNLSLAGERLLRQRGLLKDDTALARPSLTKTQATERLGRPVKSIHGDPYYLPHVMEGGAKPVNPLAATGGGKGIPRKPGATKQNLGVLALRGKLHLRGDVLGPEFLRRVKYVKYDEIHNALVRGAVRVTRQQLEEHYGGQLPKGYEYVRVKAGQRIPATMRGESDISPSLQKLLPDPEDLHGSQLAKEGFTTTDASAAHESGGNYYIVPKQMVKAATGEFTRSSDFTHAFVKTPLKVWRSAVLGLRVGFLTNNLVGNSIMYAAKTGGQGALRDLFMAIRESHGDGVAKQVLDNAATPPPLRQSLYQEFFPEQMHGTFGRTQSPSASKLTEAAGKAGRGFNAVTGAIPRLTSAVAETGFRKALIRHYIRHSPEFRTVYKQLPKQTRSFEAAAEKVLTGDAGKAYQRMISKQVNNALGDYLNLSATERNVLRNALPFYSWYRAITVTTAHLAVDTPLRANILGQLGQIGRQWSDDKLGDVPSFLEGSIPLGDGKQGTQRVLATQGLNPYATLEQERRAVTGDVTALGLNPFVQTALDEYARRKYNGGVGPGQLAGATLQSMLLGLPPSRLIAPPGPSQLYPTRDRRTAELGYLGLPIKEYSRAVAARQKQQGR